MELRNLVLGFVMATLLAGCSVFTSREQADYKTGAVQSPALEVPPDLTAPATEQRYTIPGTDEQAANYSEYSKEKTEQPCPNPAVDKSTGGTKAIEIPKAPAVVPTVQISAAKLKDNNGIKSIVLYEPFDRSWRRVGLALDHAKFVTTDKDRSRGIFFVTPPTDKDSNKKQPDYQVMVGQNTDESSEVTIVDLSGKNSAETTRLVEVLYRNLGDKAPSAEGGRPRGGMRSKGPGGMPPPGGAPNE